MAAARKNAVRKSTQQLHSECDRQLRIAFGAASTSSLASEAAAAAPTLPLLTPINDQESHSSDSAVLLATDRQRSPIRSSFEEHRAALKTVRRVLAFCLIGGLGCVLVVGVLIAGGVLTLRRAR